MTQSFTWRIQTLSFLLISVFQLSFFAASAQAPNKPTISYDRLLCVKFKNDLPVYASQGKLTDGGSGVLKSFESFTEAGTFSKMIDLSEQQLDEMRYTAQLYWEDVAREEGRKAVEVGDMNNYFIYEIKPGTDAKNLLRRLKSHPAIEYAEKMPEPVAPTLPGNYVANQTYLNVGSGINANQVYTTYSNRGGGIRVADIEYNFNSAHADLPAVTMIAGTQTYNGYGNNHGTAVFGELVSRNNGWGTTGIASSATPYFAGAHNTSGVYNPSNSILLASAAITAGDVILLEQQIAGPYYTGVPEGTQFGLVPVEYNFAIFQAIQTAVGNGRIVVEAAGNGSQNLNDPQNAAGSNNHNPFGGANSGAIIVGAGAAAPSGSTTARSRLNFSNYGTRVNLQGFGEGVWTTGYGSAYNAEGENYFYTSGFSGTSSASPIVTGACVLLQSVFKNTTGSVLTPAQVRSHLITTGQAQQAGINPVSQNIGPLPNVYAAIQSALSTVVCPAPTAAQSNVSAITTTTARLNCTASGSEFDFTYRPAGGAWIHVNHGPANFYNLTGLTANTQYEYRTGVKCNGTGNWSSWSDIKSFYTACPDPTVAHLSASAVLATTARLNCSTPGGSAFDWRYRAVGAATWINVNHGAANFYNLTGLAAATQYEFQAGVQCTASGYWSSWSPSQTFTTACADPTVAQISATNITQTSARINCSTPGTEYDWAYRVAGGVWVHVPHGAANYFDITGLNPSTQYEYQAGVRCTNGSWSNWSPTRTFTTSALANDNPCTAITIAANSSCLNTTGTTGNATSTFATSVCGVAAPRDVWFRCVIPASGRVTFRTTAGTLTDATMAVYSGAACNTLNYISCEDNNTNGNGSLMPVLTVTGASGTQLWVRVWGKNNASGTFNICALNYSSTDFGGRTVSVKDAEGLTLTDTDWAQEAYVGEVEERTSKVQPGVSTTTEQLTEAATAGSVYPNPTTGMVTLPFTLTESSAVHILVTDAMGRAVAQQNIQQDAGTHTAQLDLSQCASGLYMVRFQSGRTVHVQQLSIVQTK